MEQTQSREQLLARSGARAADVSRTRAIDDAGVRYGVSATKRVLDVALALLLLPVALLVMLVAAPLLFMVWRCNPFFGQERIGARGEPFPMWKLRTLPPSFAAQAPKPDADAIESSGWLCRWLRSTGLDECPQLWNVLRGEMSLVGPRPEMPFVAATHDARCRRRLAVRPGITGLWQVAGDHRRPIHHQIAYDLLYLRRASLALDLWICVQTVAIALGSGRLARALKRVGRK